MEDDDIFDESDFYGSSEPVQDTAPILDPEYGQGDVADDAGAADANASEASQAKYFDPTTVADHVVKVKVNGEELDVPVTDLVSGYSRTADYTRKTQELAQQREQIAFWQQVDQAMRTNPDLTLQYLQRTYGVDSPQASGQSSQQSYLDDDWGYEAQPDPVQRELQELKSMVMPAIQYQQQQQADAHLQRTVAGLSARYGNDFNPTEVIQEALNRGVYDPTALEYVYKDMMFDQLRAKAAAATTFQGQAAANDAQRRAAAANAANVIGAGGSARGVSVGAAPPQPRGRLSVRQAFELAKRELDG